MSRSDEQMLDDLFALGRAQTPEASSGLMARVQADAQNALFQEPTPRRSAWAGLVDFIGGWPAIGGLAMAGVTGLWFGIAPPTSVSTFTADLIGTTVTVDLLDDTSTYFTETLTDG